MGIKETIVDTIRASRGVAGLDLNEMRAGVAKGLAHPTRVRLVETLSCVDEESVSQLSATLRQSQPTVSKHLAILREAGLVGFRREGTSVLYSLRSAGACDILKCIDRVLQADVHVRGEQLKGAEVDDGATGERI